LFYFVAYGRIVHQESVAPTIGEERMILPRKVYSSRINGNNNGRKKGWRKRQQQSRFFSLDKNIEIVAHELACLSISKARKDTIRKNLRMRELLHKSPTGTYLRNHLVHGRISRNLRRKLLLTLPNIRRMNFQMVEFIKQILYVVKHKQSNVWSWGQLCFKNKGMIEDYPMTP